MSQSRKHRGYRSQKVVAEYLAQHGFPHAESTGAGRSGADVTGVGKIDFEVKARNGFQAKATLGQMAERAQEGILPVAVLRLNGQGEQSIGEWAAVLPFSVLVELLRKAGYDKKAR